MPEAEPSIVDVEPNPVEELPGTPIETEVLVEPQGFEEEIEVDPYVIHVEGESSASPDELIDDDRCFVAPDEHPTDILKFPIGQQPYEGSPFDRIRRHDEHGEFWLARDLAAPGLFNYSEWRSMQALVEKAIVNFRSLGIEPSDHIGSYPKLVKTGSGAFRPIEDYRLTRYACYLVVLAGESTKTEVGAAKNYFAVQTRRAEKADEERAAQTDPLLGSINALAELRKNQIAQDNINKQQDQINTDLSDKAKKTNERLEANEAAVARLKRGDHCDPENAVISEFMKEPESRVVFGKQFDFKGHEVRIVNGQDGEPWWIMADVCEVLTISNSRDASSRLDDDEKGVITTDTLGGPQELSTINESGLYSLIMTSRKPEAKAFRKWVTSVVLPSIRKTGRYEAPGAQTKLPEKPAETELGGILKMLAAGHLEHKTEISELKKVQQDDRAWESSLWTNLLHTPNWSSTVARQVVRCRTSSQPDGDVEGIRCKSQQESQGLASWSGCKFHQAQGFRFKCGLQPHLENDSRQGWSDLGALADRKVHNL